MSNIQNSYPKVGQRIRLRQDVPRFDAFLAKKGMTGTVTIADPEAAFLSAKMDQPLSEDPNEQEIIESEWENSIHWYDLDFPNGSSISALEDFLNDCEYIE